MSYLISLKKGGSGGNSTIVSGERSRNLCHLTNYFSVNSLIRIQPVTAAASQLSTDVVPDVVKGINEALAAANSMQPQKDKPSKAERRRLRREKFLQSTPRVDTNPAPCV
jgi:hypothetical protein